MSDEQIMRRLQQNGDPRAFSALVERWEQPIFRLCARMTGDTMIGEDLKQEVFARVFAHRMDFRGERARFSTWMWRIAVNLCHDELRRRQRTPRCNDTVEIEELADDSLAPDLTAARNDEAELLRRAVLRLPECYRSVVLLRHTEGLKLREIAEVLGIPEGTVASRLNEGLQQLSRILRPQFERGSASPLSLNSNCLTS